MCYNLVYGHAIVAQLDRAFGSDPEGQRFESSRSHQSAVLFKGTAFFVDGSFCGRAKGGFEQHRPAVSSGGQKSPCGAFL